LKIKKQVHINIQCRKSKKKRFEEEGKCNKTPFSHPMIYLLQKTSTKCLKISKGGNNKP